MLHVDARNVEMKSETQTCAAAACLLSAGPAAQFVLLFRLSPIGTLYYFFLFIVYIYRIASHPFAAPKYGAVSRICITHSV